MFPKQHPSKPERDTDVQNCQSPCRNTDTKTHSRVPHQCGESRFSHEIKKHKAECNQAHTNTSSKHKKEEKKRNDIFLKRFTNVFTCFLVSLFFVVFTNTNPGNNRQIRKTKFFFGNTFRLLQKTFTESTMLYGLGSFFTYGYLCTVTVDLTNKRCVL